MKRKILQLVGLIGIIGVLLTACISQVNIATGVPNLGWESGVVGPWNTGTAGGSIAPVNITTLCRTMAPRSGSYTSCYFTGSSSSVNIWVDYAITDTTILNQLAGKDVTWTIWVQTRGEFAGAAPVVTMKISDDAGDDSIVPAASAGVYVQRSITRTITASPTFIEFEFRWAKMGGQGIVSWSMDDMTISEPIIAYSINDQWPDFISTFTLFGTIIIGFAALFTVVLILTKFGVPSYLVIASGVMLLMILVTTSILDPSVILIGVMLGGVMVFIMLIRGRGGSDE